MLGDDRAVPRLAALPHLRRLHVEPHRRPGLDVVPSQGRDVGTRVAASDALRIPPAVVRGVDVDGGARLPQRERPLVGEAAVRPVRHPTVEPDDHVAVREVAQGPPALRERHVHPRLWLRVRPRHRARPAECPRCRRDRTRWPGVRLRLRRTAPVASSRSTAAVATTSTTNPRPRSLRAAARGPARRVGIGSFGDTRTGRPDSPVDQRRAVRIHRAHQGRPMERRLRPGGLLPCPRRRYRYRDCVGIQWVLVRIGLMLVAAVGLLWPIALNAFDSAGGAPATDPVTITDYDATFDVAQDGTLTAVEDITAEFPAGRHGIFRYWDLADQADPGVRYLPEITSITQDGAEATYDTSWESGRRFLVAKIGDPDITLSPGSHRYRISYSIDGSISPATAGASQVFASDDGSSDAAARVGVPLGRGRPWLGDAHGPGAGHRHPPVRQRPGPVLGGSGLRSAAVHDRRRRHHHAGPLRPGPPGARGHDGAGGHGHSAAPTAPTCPGPSSGTRSSVAPCQQCCSSRWPPRWRFLAGLVWARTAREDSPGLPRAVHPAGRTGARPDRLHAHREERPGAARRRADAPCRPRPRAAGPRRRGRLDRDQHRARRPPGSPSTR